MTDNAGPDRVDDLDVLLEDATRRTRRTRSSAARSRSVATRSRCGMATRATSTPKQRDTLVALLKKSFISSDDKDAWRTLMRDPDPIVTNLNNLYFILVVDERAEVAFATPARNADNPFKTLVRDAPNNREETLLLIYLRERHRAETASGQPTVYADVAAMLDYVARFRPASATDMSGDEKTRQQRHRGPRHRGPPDQDRRRGPLPRPPCHRSSPAAAHSQPARRSVPRPQRGRPTRRSTGDGEGNSTEEIGDQLVDEEGRGRMTATRDDAFGRATVARPAPLRPRTGARPVGDEQFRPGLDPVEA